MTPEELDRTIEFILQHEARFEARLDREQKMRQARLAEHKKIIENLASLQARVVELIAIESGRLDRQDQAITRLTRIVDRQRKELSFQLPRVGWRESG
jgi:hypothetical protein